VCGSAAAENSLPEAARNQPVAAKGRSIRVFRTGHNRKVARAAIVLERAQRRLKLDHSEITTEIATNIGFTGILLAASLILC
jgi:hypothetical protein